MRLAGWAHVRERAFSDVWTLTQVPNLSPLDALYGMNVVSHEAFVTVTPLERPIRRPIRPLEVRSGIHIDCRLAHEATSVTEARAALRALEGAVDPNTFETLRLLVSEVVTNSVRHGTNESSDEIELSVDASRERIRIEVSDAGPGFNPAAREEDADQGSGWGLHLIDVLSDRWGTDLNGRMRVWFELVDSGAWTRAPCLEPFTQGLDEPFVMRGETHG